MTKKHFIVLADKTRQLLAELERNSERMPQRDMQGYQVEPCDVVNTALVRSAVLAMLADFCRSQNLRFDRERWLAYIAGECGPNGGRTCKG